MYSRRQQNLIGRTDALEGVLRRRLLQGAAAFGVAASLRPTAVFAVSSDDDEDERLGPFGRWSTPVNLGPVVNSQFNERFPAISKDGLSLYFQSERPGGVNGANSGQVPELWVSKRASLHAPWQTPINLDAFNPVPVINSIGNNTGGPNFSSDGHQMFFFSARPHPDACGANDLYGSWRKNKRDDFGWQEPVNLGCMINSPQDETAPNYFEDEENGTISMYFTSNRPGGPPGSLPDSFHIYVSTLGDDGLFGAAVLVPELSSAYGDTTTAIRHDGLEFFVRSTRPEGRIGLEDIFVSTRESTAEPWSTPVSLGSPINYPGYSTASPSLSWDGTTLYFWSDRPGGIGGQDLYVSTRRKLREQ
jgi:hypothetical protein